MRRAAATGSHLPRIPALADLYAKGVDFRSSQLWMLIGRPGAGKTFCAQWLVSEIAAQARRDGDECPGMYFFLDGTPFTAAVRQAAWATGHATKDIAKALEDGGPVAGFYEEALSELAGDISFVFDKRPELPEIQKEIDAYVELWDRYPSWIIFDNLLNFDGCFEDHHAQKFVLGELQALAYQTGASVGVLHHASESGVKDYSKAPKVNDADGKVTQLPEMVLTVAKDPDSDRFSIAVGKLRDGGASDPSGDKPVTLWSDLSRVQFAAHRPAPSGWGYQQGEGNA